MSILITKDMKDSLHLFHAVLLILSLPFLHIHHVSLKFHKVIIIILEIFISFLSIIQNDSMIQNSSFLTNK